MASDKCSQIASPKPQAATGCGDQSWSLQLGKVLQSQLWMRRAVGGSRAMPALYPGDSTCALCRDAAVGRRGVVHHRHGLARLLFILQLNRTTHRGQGVPQGSGTTPAACCVHTTHSSGRRLLCSTTGHRAAAQPPSEAFPLETINLSSLF